MIYFLALSILGFSLNSQAMSSCGPQMISEDDAAYPAAKIFKTVMCDKRPTNKVLIQELEALLFHKAFKLLIEKQGQTYKLHVGTTGSFSLWRDLINLNLGRAYYEEGEYKKALKYYDSVVVGSRYFPMAALEANFVSFKTKDYEAVKGKLAILKPHSKSKEEHQEYQLQEGLLHLRTGNYKLAFTTVESLNFKSVELQELKLKVLGESLFAQYLNVHTQLPFAEKVKMLKVITDAVESIRPVNRDPSLVYLAAEAYWHTASAYRIEDPDKNQTIWHKQLEIADDWISPAVEKSIHEGKAQLNEEAFFFSIALLWEREFHKKALVRLKNLDKLYPQGVYREDAYQLLGDYYFDEHDFKEAIPYYRKLAQVGSESKAAYGVYKAAWSFYNAKDKWKSLRHFERLFQFYLDKTDIDEGKNELMKESRQDLLLVISEILPSAKGVEELKTFKVAAVETKNMIRDLAKLYQRNGNYKDSTDTWSYLLDHHLADAEAPQWIIELALDNYADGKRDQISRSIKKYYPMWRQNSFSESGDKLIGLEWSKIILSLHREAKKSEDPLFWKSTDLAYETYEELKPNGQEAEVWYFGAQKFQFQNNFWKSVEWFKRAADVKGYLQADDAALSALGLLNDKSGDLSIIENKEPLKPEYAKLAIYAHWFFNRPSEKLAIQKELSHFIYSEALFFTGEYLKAREFLVSLFNKSQQNNEAWNVYLSHNKRLYKASAWNESYELALALQNSDMGKNKDKFIFLANIAQENAFQLAFVAEKDKPQNLKTLRKWYEIAFTLPSAEEATKIKSWHNYLLSFSHEEVVIFESNLKTFVKLWEDKGPKDAATHQLYFNIYAKALKIFESAKLPFKKGEYLYLASEHSSDSKLRESLLWDAVVIHASYHQWKHFDERLSKLEEFKSEYFSEPKYLSAIARFKFSNREFEQSWKLAKKLVQQDQNQGNAWLIISDLFHYGEFKDEITDFLVGNEKKFKDIVWIRPLWAEIKTKEFFISADLSDLKLDRQLASTPPEENNDIVLFKERLALVAASYKLMNAKKEKLKSAIISWIPATGAHAVCLSPQLTLEAYKEIYLLKKTPIASDQWPQFVAKLDEKLGELKLLEEKESANCQQARNDILFIGDFKPSASPICAEKGCLTKLSVSEKEIIEMENKFVDGKDRFIASVLEGATAQAETYAAFETNKALQIYFYAILRLAADDVWNAYVLLQDLEKQKGWEAHAVMIKKLIAEKNDRKDLAQTWQPKVDPQLSSMEHRLFSRR